MKIEDILLNRSLIIVTIRPQDSLWMRMYVRDHNFNLNPRLLRDRANYLSKWLPGSHEIIASIDE